MGRSFLGYIEEWKVWKLLTKRCCDQVYHFKSEKKAVSKVFERERPKKQKERKKTKMIKSWSRFRGMCKETRDGGGSLDDMKKRALKTKWSKSIWFRGWSVFRYTGQEIKGSGEASCQKEKKWDKNSKRGGGLEGQEEEDFKLLCLTSWSDHKHDPLKASLWTLQSIRKRFTHSNTLLGTPIGIPISHSLILMETSNSDPDLIEVYVGFLTQCVSWFGWDT